MTTGGEENFILSIHELYFWKRAVKRKCDCKFTWLKIDVTGLWWREIMGQVLKAGGDKTHLGSQANKLLSKSATFFYTKSCIPVRVVLQPSPPSPHCPPPPRSPLISAVSNLQIPLHFLNFISPNSQITSPTSFYSGSSGENRIRGWPQRRFSGGPRIRGKENVLGKVCNPSTQSRR